MLQLRSKGTLDHGDRGWLKTRHHFVVSADGPKDSIDAPKLSSARPHRAATALL
jgi:hypothetical protein